MPCGVGPKVFRMAIAKGEDTEAAFGSMARVICDKSLKPCVTKAFETSVNNGPKTVIAPDSVGIVLIKVVCAAAFRILAPLAWIVNVKSAVVLPAYWLGYSVCIPDRKQVFGIVPHNVATRTGDVIVFIDKLLKSSEKTGKIMVARTTAQAG